MYCFSIHPDDRQKNPWLFWVYFTKKTQALDQNPPNTMDKNGKNY
jgi:hypothetical protein